jgi:cell division protein FtsW
VLLWGSDVNGARRTILDGRVQPSELAKVTILCYGATWLASRRGQLTNFMNGLLPFSAIVGITVGAIVLEPDLSTAIIIIIAAFGMLFLAGASIPQMAIIGAIGLCLFGLILAMNFFPHAVTRLTDFLAGLKDFTKASEHIQYAMLAVTDGGWFGRGIGTGFSKFATLPAPHTDSVFAVLAEELGLVGVVVTLGLFILLAYRGLIIARRSDSPFGSYFAIGIIMWLMMQTVLNMLANVGWLPLPGVPVPFLSVGGSSLVAVMIGCGVLFSISRGSRLLSEEGDDGDDDAPQRRNVYGANNTIRRWDSRTRAARTDRAAEPNNDHSTTIIGRDIRFTPRLRRDKDSSIVRWRKGGNGTGPRLPRGR